MSLIEYYCVTHDAGSWSEDALGSDGKSIVEFHRCLGCNVVKEQDKPRLRGKKHWGHTEIEKQFTDYMILHFDEIFQGVT
jgi:hypothetical protein